MKRITSLDAIRGFSLLGILLANLLIFQYGVFGVDDLADVNHQGGDALFYYVTKLFIEGSFMPIFGFVFGYSVILMKQSLERNQLKVKRHLARRAVALIIFGTIHALFLWEGDILLTYGIMLLCLLFFINCRPKTLLIWATAGFSLLTILSLLGGGAAVEMLIPEEKAAYLAEASEAYGKGTYSDILRFELLVDPPLNISIAEMFSALLILPLLVLPIFMLGMYAAHKGLLDRFEKVKAKHLYIAIGLIVTGILSKMTLFQSDTLDLSLIGGTILALGYICLFAHLYNAFPKAEMMKAFENVGRLSLTNYLMQSVICTYVFYGYGFGYFERMGIMYAFLLGIVIFIIQVIASTAYFYCFKQGPFEKIMRSFVYLNLFKRKVTTEVPALEKEN